MAQPIQRIVILTALPLEYLAIRAHLINPKIQVHEKGTHIEEGELPGVPWRVAIAQLGPGNLNAAALTERISSWLRPIAMFFVGIAGSLKDDVNLGDVVVGTIVYAYQGGKQDLDGFKPRSRNWTAPHRLEQAAQLALLSNEWTSTIYSERPPLQPAVHFKPIAAGEVVLNSAESTLSQQLRSHYGDAVAIEMESAGFAQAAHLSDSLPALTVRGISDKADGLKHLADAGGGQPQAAAHAAAATIAIITALSSIPMPGPDATEFNRTDLPDGQRPMAQTPSEDHEVLAWSPLAHPADVTWRRSQNNQSSGGGAATLEIHLAPVTSEGRITVRRLEQLAEELIAIGRASGLFSAAQEVRTATDGQVVTATAITSYQNTVGLAVYRSGQRSIWQPLPHDGMGGVLDSDEIPEQISQLLGVLTQLPLPMPTSIALGIGVDPAIRVSEDKVNNMPRSRAQLSPDWVQRPLRVEPDDSVASQALMSHRNDIADELAASLLSAFRNPRRSF